MLSSLKKKAATIVLVEIFCSGKAAATGHAHADISGVTARIFALYLEAPLSVHRRPRLSVRARLRRRRLPSRVS